MRKFLNFEKIANRVRSYPQPNMTARQTALGLKSGRFKPLRESQFRARPRINTIIRKVAKEHGIPLVEADRLIKGEDQEPLFWDGMHPRPTLHQRLAKAFLETAVEAGYIERYVEPQIHLSTKELARGGTSAAYEAIGQDPAFVLRVLTSLETKGINSAVARALAGYMAAETTTMDQAMEQAASLLSKPAHRDAYERCIKTNTKPCGLRCLLLPCGRDMLSDAERGELVRLSKRHKTPLLSRIFELL